ncbi:hypothetical protein G7Y89_g11732 [Cudoniella acicularis]|uniref:Plastocyanin-like domain-containing protein n=1 Tax=Cudoniella acicularis TaxID=354080 RepID=A0A8H4VY13_9HELO|nr:hypothetical protein G7Y89_g11732 [Cudoniella acicularis]
MVRLSSLPLLTLLLSASVSAQTNKLRYMPFGDSITEIVCWRGLLWTQMQTAGYKNTEFVGSGTNQNPSGCKTTNYEKNNEGHSGFLAIDIADKKQLVDWLKKNPADLITMHLGTNDIVQKSKKTEDIITAFTLNKAIPAWAVSKNTTQSPIWVVDQYTGFSTTDLRDGVHPNESGDTKMAAKWYPAIINAINVIEAGNSTVAREVEFVAFHLSVEFAGYNTCTASQFSLLNSSFCNTKIHAKGTVTWVGPNTSNSSDQCSGSVSRKIGRAELDSLLTNEEIRLGLRADSLSKRSGTQGPQILPLKATTALLSPSFQRLVILSLHSGIDTKHDIQKRHWNVTVNKDTEDRCCFLSGCASQMDGKLPYYQPLGFNFSGNVRRYYVAAEVEAWNYAPTGWDNWLGVPMNESFRAQTYGYIGTNTSIGTTYDKALYRGYTGPDFMQRSEQPDWLGFTGPILRGEVGDMIEIMFVNKLDSFYATMHSMGLFYTKDSEGSLYPNGTSEFSEGDAVPPGGCVVYKWLIPPSSAPDPGVNSKLWAYHSYVSMYQDTDAGLTGPVIVYNPGTMNKTMASNREFIIFYGDNQESNSFLALHNVQKYLPNVYPSVKNESDTYPVPTNDNRTFWYPQEINSPLTTVNTSVAANFFPINGYIYANNPTFTMCLNDAAIWYIMDMGFDTHVAHWHGNNVVHNGITMASVPINPGQMLTTHMTATNPGMWQLICHFNTHLKADKVKGDAMMAPWAFKEPPETTPNSFLPISYNLDDIPKPILRRENELFWEKEPFLEIPKLWVILYDAQAVDLQELNAKFAGDEYSVLKGSTQCHPAQLSAYSNDGLRAKERRREVALKGPYIQEAETITRLGEPDLLTRRQLFRKIIKGFKEEDYTLAQAELRIKQLEARAIKEAQIEAGDREIDKEDSDSSIESTATSDCALGPTAVQQTREMLIGEPMLANRNAEMMTKPWVKWAYQPVRAKDVPAALIRAIATATMPPTGPVYLSIPLGDWDFELTSVPIP